MEFQSQAEPGGGGGTRNAFSLVTTRQASVDSGTQRSPSLKDLKDCSKRRSFRYPGPRTYGELAVNIWGLGCHNICRKACYWSQSVYTKFVCRGQGGVGVCYQKWPGELPPHMFIHKCALFACGVLAGVGLLDSQSLLRSQQPQSVLYFSPQLTFEV